MLIVSACFCGIFLCLCFVIYWLHQQSFEVLGCFFVFVAFFYVYVLSFIGFTSSPLKFLVVFFCFCGIFLCLCFVIYWLHQQSFEVLGCFFCFCGIFLCLGFVIYWLHQQSFEVLGCFLFLFFSFFFLFVCLRGRDEGGCFVLFSFASLTSCCVICVCCKTSCLCVSLSGQEASRGGGASASHAGRAQRPGRVGCQSSREPPDASLVH